MDPVSLTCWNDAIVPLASIAGLRSLQRALERDDRRLIQGATLSPPPLQSCSDYPVEGACPVAWIACVDPDSYTVEDAEFLFAKFCLDADAILGQADSYGCSLRTFFDWYDGTPRKQAHRELANLVRKAIHQKESGHDG